MKLLVEIGRFIVTALAVALVIPTFYALIAMIGEDRFSVEAFFGIGAISFVLAIVGGIVFGLHTLWLSRRQKWDRDIRKLSAIGIAVGACGGILLSVVFWAGNLEIIIAGLVPWAAMGAIAGLVAACVWFWLHTSDAELTANV